MRLVKTYWSDGDTATCTLDEFLVANAESFDEEDVAKLVKGERLEFGGGAAPAGYAICFPDYNVGDEVTWLGQPDGKYAIRAVIQKLGKMIAIKIVKPSATVSATKRVAPDSLRAGWPDREIRWDETPHNPYTDAALLDSMAETKKRLAR
jgi:hypothetical protein